MFSCLVMDAGGTGSSRGIGLAALGMRFGRTRVALCSGAMSMRCSTVHAAALSSPSANASCIALTSASRSSALVLLLVAPTSTTAAQLSAHRLAHPPIPGEADLGRHGSHVGDALLPSSTPSCLRVPHEEQAVQEEESLLRPPAVWIADRALDGSLRTCTP